MLKTHTYHTSKYIKFKRKENGKERAIYKLPYFPDRIVHWAIIQQIEPLLLKTFIADTYSAIPGRGLHKAAYKLSKVLRTDSNNCQYCLKLDIRHFYQNINHDILKQLYRRKFKDPELLYILDEIIDSINTAEKADLKYFYGTNQINWQTGIPIGNYLSQYSGNYYLSCLDHFIKEELRIKHYYRYMDDIIILAQNKEELHKYKNIVEKYLRNNLKLFLKTNWQIFSVAARGIDFVGYKFYFNKTMLRKTILLRLSKKLNHIYRKICKGRTFTYHDFSTINSYLGWIKPCSGKSIYKIHFKKLMDKYYCYKNHLKQGGQNYADILEYSIQF